MRFYAHALLPRQPQVPYYDEHITFVECENMTTVSGEWVAKEWAHSDNYFAATV